MDSVLQLLSHPLAPNVEASFEAVLAASLIFALLSLALAYMGAVVASWPKSFSAARRFWRAGSLITLSYLHGALFSALVFTTLIAYCHYRSTYDQWIDLVPYWTGVATALIAAVVPLVLLRRRVARVHRASFTR